MKLIDLLVRELPNHGGWPEGAAICERFLHEAHIDFYDQQGNWPEDCGKRYGLSFAKELVQPRHLGLDFRTEVVKKGEYEAALAASKQAEWNEGIPPVSTECEIFDCEKWLPVRIRYVGDYLVVVKELDGSLSERVFHIAKHPDKFRPIRTEAERKMQESINQLTQLVSSHMTTEDRSLAVKVYDAIAAGKIPGIKLIFDNEE